MNELLVARHSGSPAPVTRRCSLSAMNSLQSSHFASGDVALSVKPRRAMLLFADGLTLWGMLVDQLCERHVVHLNR